MIYSNEIVRMVPFSRDRHMTEEYRSWFHDEQTCKFNSHGLFPYSPGQMEEFVKTIEQGSSSKIVWAIEVAMSEAERKQGKGNFMPLPPDAHDRIRYRWKHIGNCSIQGINWINRSAEFAIVLGKARGLGFGKQACFWMLEHAFLKLNLRRIWTGTAATNIGMNKTCLSLGFSHEGTFKNGTFLDGEYVDVNAYGITRTAWDALR